MKNNAGGGADLSEQQTSPTRTANGIDRYPGVQPFGDNEVDCRLFRGRDREKYELLQLVLAERLVLVFGRSGLGKSSLINAGLLEPLRSREYFPMVVRITGSTDDPLANLYDGIKVATREALARYSIECQPDASQWNKTSLWHFCKTVELWRDDELLTPVLIVDQFEELFTLYSFKQRKEFVRELSSVVRGIRPKRPAATDQLSEAPPQIKIVLVMREDFYANLEELRDQIPGIYRAPMRLGALKREQAVHAIAEPAQLTGEEFSTPPFTWTEEALHEVLDFLCLRQLGDGKTEAGTDVEPFQLQLICQHVERKVRAEGLEQVTTQTFGGGAALQRILSDFYELSLDQICAKFHTHKGLRQRLERLCEYGFITARGRRLLREESTIMHDDQVPPEVLREMVELRLLRKEPRVGDNYYELTHDTLIEPIQAIRQKREDNERKRRQRRFIAVAVSFAVLIITGASTLYLQMREVWEVRDEVQEVREEKQRVVQQVKEVQVEKQATRAELEGQVKAAERRTQAAEKKAEAAQIVATTLEAVIENVESTAAGSPLILDSSATDDSPQTAAKVVTEQVLEARAEAEQLVKEAKRLLNEADSERKAAERKADQLREKAGLDLESRIAELERRVNNDELSDRELANAYGAFLAQYKDKLSNDDLTRLTADLDKYKASADQFESLEARLAKADLSGCERFDLWASYTPARSVGPEVRQKTLFKEQYANSGVAVSFHGNKVSTEMVTAAEVIDRRPVKIKSQFKPSEKIWVFAKVNSLKNSKVYFDWVDAAGDNLARSKAVNIPGGAFGYRFYDAKRLAAPGIYYALLYEKRRGAGTDTLVCRRRFAVGDIAATPVETRVEPSSSPAAPPMAVLAPTSSDTPVHDANGASDARKMPEAQPVLAALNRVQAAERSNERTLQQPDVNACGDFYSEVNQKPLGAAEDIIVNSFVTATEVKNDEAVNPRSNFKPGKIYAQVNLHAATGGRVFFEWINAEDGNLLPGKSRSKVYKIPSGQSNYRLSHWKNVFSPGTYAVNLYANDKGEDVLVCRRPFEVAK